MWLALEALWLADEEDVDILVDNLNVVRATGVATVGRVPRCHAIKAGEAVSSPLQRLAGVEVHLVPSDGKKLGWHAQQPRCTKTWRELNDKADKAATVSVKRELGQERSLQQGSEKNKRGRKRAQQGEEKEG